MLSNFDEWPGEGGEVPSHCPDALAPSSQSLRESRSPAARATRARPSGKGTAPRHPRLSADPKSNGAQPRWIALAFCAALAFVTTGCRTAAPSPPAPSALAPSTLFVNAQLIDGTGAPARAAAVRILAGQIAEVGNLEPRSGEEIVDAKGLVLAPGFIDTHSHADRDFDEHRDALGAVSQGITTVVVGQDGDSPESLAKWFAGLERKPVAVNVASYVGHNSVRDRVMGKDFKRHATPAEVTQMEALVEQGMKDGALGLSTGLEYDPGIFSDPEEVLTLARVAAKYGGRYISHIRSEDRNFWPALDELLKIGRENHMPVQVSHIKLAMRGLWGQSDRLVARLDQARKEGIDVTADIYPYTYWHSTLTVIFPERDFTNRQSAEFALSEVTPPEGLLLTGFAPDPSYVGKTVADIARLRGTDPPATLMALIAEALAYEQAHPDADSVESVIGTGMDEKDVAQLFAWPFTNLCTDGGLAGSHPRGFGSFPRALGRLVREQGAVTLPEAVRKMTSLAAHNMGFTRRGTIAPGMFADLVLFDPATILDRATTTDPWAVSVGVVGVWVNGQRVFADGKATGRFPGRTLRRETSPPG